MILIATMTMMMANMFQRDWQWKDDRMAECDDLTLELLKERTYGQYLTRTYDGRRKEQSFVLIAS
jgi:hypothetical protein